MELVTRQIAFDLERFAWSLEADMEELPYEQIMDEAVILYADIVNNDHAELNQKITTSDKMKLRFFRKSIIEMALYYKHVGIIRTMFIIHYNNDIGLWKDILDGHSEYKITFLTAMYDLRHRKFMCFMECIYNAFTPDMHAFVAEQNSRLDCSTLDLCNHYGDEDWALFDDFVDGLGDVFQR